MSAERKLMLTELLPCRLLLIIAREDPLYVEERDRDMKAD